MRKSKVNLIKHTFFNNSLKKIADLSFKEEDFDLDQLRAEFFSFYQLFLSNKQNWINYSELTLYLNYLCDLMICYYEYDYVHSELEKLRKQKKELQAFLQKNCIKVEKPSINNFSSFLLDRLKANFVEYQDSFTRISKLRTNLATLNTNRTRFGYSRALATHAIFYLQKTPIYNIIQELNHILGNPYGFVDGLNLLDETRKPSAVLGMILYAFRFLVHLTLMIKHVIQATMNKELSEKKVLKQELEKRSFTMISDLVWSLVNLLTTYNYLFYIPAAAISPLILAFLVFDALLFFAQWFFEATKYNDRLQELIVQKEDAIVFEQTVIQRQIDILNDEWEAQCHYYIINIIGAHLLAISFAITMACSIPLALAGLALVSMLGNAFYNTCEEYKKYQQAKIAVAREQVNGSILDDKHHNNLMKLLHIECDNSYIQFWSTLAFNVGGLAFIITAAVASWPIAVGLTIIYVAYQLNNAYQKQRTNHEHEGEITRDIYRLITPDHSVFTYNI